MKSDFYKIGRERELDKLVAQYNQTQDGGKAIDKVLIKHKCKDNFYILLKQVAKRR